MTVNAGTVAVNTELDVADGGDSSISILNGGVIAVGGNGFGGANASFGGTVTLSGYKSTLQINGQVQLGGQGGTPGGTSSITANAGTQVLLGDTFLYAGGTMNVNTDALGSFTVADLRDGATGSAGSVAIGANSTLTINGTTARPSSTAPSPAPATSPRPAPARRALLGFNCYTGSTNINGGVLGFGAASNLGTGPITFNGGTLQWTNNGSANTTDITTGPRAVTLNSGGGTFDTNFNSITLANPIDGIGGLTVTGGGTLTLAGTNTYWRADDDRQRRRRRDRGRQPRQCDNRVERRT